MLESLLEAAGAGEVGRLEGLKNEGFRRVMVFIIVNICRVG